MSIQFTRPNEAFVTYSKNVGRDVYITPSSIIGSAHLKHVFSVGFFEPEERYKTFAEISEKITGKFEAIKISSRRFFSIDNFNSSKFIYKGVDKGFANTLDLKLKHVLNVSTRGEFGSLRNKKATVSIDHSSQIDQVFSRKFCVVKIASSLAHIFSLLQYPHIVTKEMINIHRDRLSEWTPKGDAIVGPQ